jgi:hypothetical protein
MPRISIVAVPDIPLVFAGDSLAVKPTHASNSHYSDIMFVYIMRDKSWPTEKYSVGQCIYITIIPAATSTRSTVRQRTPVPRKSSQSWVGTVTRGRRGSCQKRSHNVAKKLVRLYHLGHLRCSFGYSGPDGRCRCARRSSPVKIFRIVR